MRLTYEDYHGYAADPGPQTEADDMRAEFATLRRVQRQDLGRYCDGWASYDGPCGATDCESCHPGGSTLSPAQPETETDSHEPWPDESSHWQAEGAYSHSVAEWQLDVSLGISRLGYADWCAAMVKVGR